jgi:excisionase family DNA binding protein
MLDVLEKRHFLPPYSPPYERDSSRLIAGPGGGDSNFLKKVENRLDTNTCSLYSYERSWSEEAQSERIDDVWIRRSTSHPESNIEMAITNTSAKRFYTVSQVCEFLAIGKTTFYKEVSSGRIQTVKVGGSTRIPTESYEQYYQARIDESRRYRADHPGRWSK